MHGALLDLAYENRMVAGIDRVDDTAFDVR
jgi:hypothetical protein